MTDAKTRLACCPEIEHPGDSMPGEHCSRNKGFARSESEIKTLELVSDSNCEGLESIPKARVEAVHLAPECLVPPRSAE